MRSLSHFHVGVIFRFATQILDALLPSSPRALVYLKSLKKTYVEGLLHLPLGAASTEG